MLGLLVCGHRLKATQVLLDSKLHMRVCDLHVHNVGPDVLSVIGFVWIHMLYSQIRKFLIYELT